MTPTRRCWSYSFRTLLVAVVCLVLAWGCWEVFRSLVRASFGYSVAAEFEAMPAGDEKIEAWLREQSGVEAHTVVVSRSGSTKLAVSFIQSRNLRGQPQFPDLNAKCKALGYVGDDADFRDVRR